MAATWRTSVPDTMALIQRQTGHISLGGSVRVAVDIVGWAPILLDRWEFEAMGAKTKEADHFRRAVTVRALAHELRIALETKETISPEDIGHVPACLQALSATAREEVASLTRLAESADSAHQRRYQLTRDNMSKEVDAVTERCRQLEIFVEAPPAAAAPGTSQGM